MSNKTQSDTKKKAMIKALESSLGVVTTACKQVGIGRDTHYRWVREDMDYAAAVQDLSNVTLDFAESKLHEQIMEGNTAAIIFFLKTKGKVRGYIERSEVVMDKKKPDLSGLTDEEIMNLVKYDEGDFA
jgi:hypothetical protein